MSIAIAITVVAVVAAVAVVDGIISDERNMYRSSYTHCLDNFQETTVAVVIVVN